MLLPCLQDSIAAFTWVLQNLLRPEDELHLLVRPSRLGVEEAGLLLAVACGLSLAGCGMLQAVACCGLSPAAGCRL